MPTSTITPMSLFGKSPLEGKSWLRSSGAASDELDVGRKAGEGTETPAKLLHLSRLWT